MARSSNSGPKKPAAHPVYTVVRLTGPTTLEILDAQVQAKTQEAACDSVVEKLPVEDRYGTFAAFLFGSYREFGYETETKVITKAKPRDPSFGTTSEHVAVAADLAPEPEPAAA